MVSLSSHLHHQRPPRNFKDENTPGGYSESWMQRTDKPPLAIGIEEVAPSIHHEEWQGVLPSTGLRPHHVSARFQRPQVKGL